MPQTTGSAPMVHGQPHHVGFNNALDEALKKMSVAAWAKGPHDVEVSFQLEVDVQSPGKVGFYKVTLNG